MTSFMRSAFSRHIRSSEEHVGLNANEVHVVPYLTGGLKKLFRDVQNDDVIIPQEYGFHTNNDGQFLPVGKCLMGMRYLVKELLDTKGQSAVLVLAEDQFEEGLDGRPTLVVIKVLHSHQYNLGAQESHVLTRLRTADPMNHSHTLRLLRTLTFDSHYCMVFEPLLPDPLTTVFSTFPSHMKLNNLRILGLRLLTSIGFLHQQDMIHTDLKPENILLKNENDLDSVHIVDFGNTINYTHREMSMYYKDFKLQTPLYRAPEVMFGVLFGPEIDMWSLGCILAELYIGKPLFFGNTNEEIVIQITEILGPFPTQKYRAGKYFKQLKKYSSDELSHNGTLEILAHLQDVTGVRCTDIQFADLLAGLLKYDPDERLSVSQAAKHPFFASQFPVAFLQPKTSGSDQYCTGVLPKVYTFSPEISDSIRRKKPSSLDLLSLGTSKLESLDDSVVVKPSPRLGQVTGGSLRGSNTPGKSNKLDILNSVRVKLVNDDKTYSGAKTQNQLNSGLNKHDSVGNSHKMRTDQQTMQNKLASLMQTIQQEQDKVECEMDKRQGENAQRKAFNQFCGKRKNIKVAKQHTEVRPDSETDGESSGVSQPKVKYGEVCRRPTKDHVASGDRDSKYKPSVSRYNTSKVIKQELDQGSLNSSTDDIDSHRKRHADRYRQNNEDQLQSAYIANSEKLIDNRTSDKDHFRKMNLKKIERGCRDRDVQNTNATSSKKSITKLNSASKSKSSDTTFTINKHVQQQNNQSYGHKETKHVKRMEDNEQTLVSPSTDKGGNKTNIKKYRDKEIFEKQSRSLLASPEDPECNSHKFFGRIPARHHSDNESIDPTNAMTHRLNNLTSSDTTLDKSRNSQKFASRKTSSTSKHQMCDYTEHTNSINDADTTIPSHKHFSNSSNSVTVISHDSEENSRIKTASPYAVKRDLVSKSKKRQADSSDDDDDEYFDLLSPGVPVSQKRLKSNQHHPSSSNKRYTQMLDDNKRNGMMRSDTKYQEMLMSHSQTDSEPDSECYNRRYTSTSDNVCDLELMHEHRSYMRVHCRNVEGKLQQDQPFKTKQKSSGPSPHSQENMIRKGSSQGSRTPSLNQNRTTDCLSSGKRRSVYNFSDGSSLKKSSNADHSLDIAYRIAQEKQQKRKKARKSLMFQEDNGSFVEDLEESEGDDSETEEAMTQWPQYHSMGDNSSRSGYYMESSEVLVDKASEKRGDRSGYYRETADVLVHRAKNNRGGDSSSSGHYSETSDVLKHRAKKSMRDSHGRYINKASDVLVPKAQENRKDPTRSHRKLGILPDTTFTLDFESPSH